IGLTLVQRLVELHGGTVRAHSEGPGCGSEFTVILPALAEAPQPSAEPSAPGPVRNETGGSRRILVVDDNVDCAEILANVVKPVDPAVLEELLAGGVAPASK